MHTDATTRPPARAATGPVASDAEVPRLVIGAYVGNVLAAGVPGALTVVAPAWAAGTLYGLPPGGDPVLVTMLGSVWAAVGLVSAAALAGGPALRRRLLPLLVVQVVYKAAWLVVAAPGLVADPATRGAALPFAAFFSVVVVVFACALAAARRATPGAAGTAGTPA